MTYESFKHTEPDGLHDKKLTLHDCVSDRISFEENTLRFFLPDGFWITAQHEENPSGQTVRTDAAAVDFTIEDMDDILVRVFTRNTRFRSRKISVEIWDMERLMASVNSGECTIEFITQYRSHFEQMWHCGIRSGKRPYYRECQLHLPDTEAVYRWNNLRLDCQW